MDESTVIVEGSSEELEIPLYETRNMSQAAYLVMSGLVLKDAKRKQRKDQRGPEFLFLFEDPHNIGQELAKQFLSSEASRFDDAMRKVRMLLNS